MNVLITGGSSGIGIELVRIFAQSTENKVFTLGRSEPSFDIKNTNISYLQFDLKDYFSERENLLNEINVFFPDEAIDIVINNAGNLQVAEFGDFTRESLFEMFEVNFFAVFGLLQDLKLKLSQGEAAHIVNIGSMGGFQGSVKFPGLAAYSASKAALANLTECLAQEWSETNIKVNCLALGSVDTEMLRKAFPGYKAATSAFEMAKFISDFALTGHRFFNGKVLPVASSTP